MSKQFFNFPIRKMDDTVCGYTVTADAVKKYLDRENAKNPDFTLIGYLEPITIGIQNISHKIESLRIENSVLYGTVTVLKTERGKILEELLEVMELGDQLKFGIAGNILESEKPTPNTTVITDLDITSINIISP